MKPRILVADDDSDLRRVVRGILEPLGHVLEARDGAEALRLFRVEKPVVMLLDIVMPEMSGIEVLQTARELAPTLPVLMLTGEADLAMARLALEHGARAYITKPFDPQVLHDEVRRLVEGADGGEKTPSGRPWRVRR
jgi:DNA-binding response OmpR family regulator